MGRKSKPSRGSSDPAGTLVASNTPPARTPLEAVESPGTAQYITALKQLGYQSVEEAANVIQVAGREVARYLEIEPNKLDEISSAMQAVATP